MKKEVIRHNQVGTADHGWLQAKHYFSFGSYYNPERMGFGKLRVVNDDRIAAGTGFGTHPHRDMEIITIPTMGRITHEDSMGQKGEIQKDEVQVMSAGTGIFHSEYNLSTTDDLKLFQIWIEPNKMSVKPRYDQATFPIAERKKDWTQLVSPIDQRGEGLKIHQNAFINSCLLSPGDKTDYKLHDSKNGLFLLVVDGEIQAGDETLSDRDALLVSDFKSLQISASQKAQIIAIEVPL